MALSFKKFVKGIFVQNDTDRTKEVGITVDNAASSGTATEIVAKQTLNRTLELPDVSGELVEKDYAQTLTNKTIDGDNNTLQDISLPSLKTELADADKFIARDASGQVVSVNAVPTTNVVGVDDVQTLTNKTIDVDSNTITNIENDNIKSGANIDLNKLASVTTNRVIESNGSGVLSSSTVTSTELQLLSGVTGTLTTNTGTQTLTNKTIDVDLNTVSNIENDNIKSGAAIALNKLASTTASRALVSDVSGVISPSTVLSSEVDHLSGVTSSIQTQLDSKQARSVLTTKGDLYVATANATTTRQSIGTDGQVLTADSSESTGIRWATAASAPDASYEISNLTLSTSVAANALTISVKTKANNDPSGGDLVKVGMRSSTLTSGLYNQRIISSALSLVVSSGSTLGHSSGSAHNIWVYLIDNAGSLELAVSQTLFPETGVISTTAEGGVGAADSNRVVYSSVARTNVPFRLIGKLVSNQTTAGTWVSVPTTVSVGDAGTLGKDLIFVEYNTTSGQSITGGVFTKINFNTKVTDSHNSFNGATGTFTALRSSVYTIQTACQPSAQAAGTQKVLAIYKNTSNYRSLNSDRNYSGIGLDDQMIQGSTSLFLSAGETLDIRVIVSATQNLTTSAGSNWITISSEGE